MITRPDLDRFIRDFRRAEGGLIALKFAFALPALAVMVAGGVDLSAVVAARQRMSDVADAAALAGARDLGLAVGDQVAIRRAEAYVDDAIEQWGQHPDITRDIAVEQDGGDRVLAVRLHGHRVSFFANLLPPGGWNFDVVSKAAVVGRTPLCVLGIGDVGKTVISIDDRSRLQAPECMVHSNRDIVANGSITAERVQAVTSATGIISPSPGQGAATVADPFASMTLDENQPCSGPQSVEVVRTGVTYLNPGVHCGGYKLAGDARLVLLPGDHWFLGGHLQLSENAAMTGDDVVLLFDKQSKFDFAGASTVHLEGRREGSYAGLVIAATRGNTQDFIISSDNVDTLLGVIYVPQARLVVEGDAEVARDSAWTVVVARWLHMEGTASLVINANYGSTPVPVPKGVGPNAGGARLLN